jgi:hypothetical protein
MRAIAMSLSSLAIAAFATVTPVQSADRPKPTVRGDVLAAVEVELARLARQAEKETGSTHPRPSSEVAFLLLTGLAVQATPVNQPAEDLARLGILPTNRERVQVFSVADDIRIVIRAVAIQDKGGYWTSKRATLYRRQGEKWVENGAGSTAVDGIALPD